MIKFFCFHFTEKRCVFTLVLIKHCSFGWWRSWFWISVSYIFMHSLRYSSIDRLTVPLSLNLISLPTNVCCFPPSHCHFAKLTFYFLYYPIHYWTVDMWYFGIINVPTHTVHWLPSIGLLATHGSYGLISNPSSYKHSLKVRYHNYADCIQPYNALVNCRYRVFYLSL